MRLTRLVFLIGFLLSTHAFAQSALEWSGDWDTFWRDGEARMTLRQAGDRVDGRYAPGDGTIEGRIDGRLLRGVWRQDGAEGEIVFALSEDGQIFTGRFAGGEYWNGSRVAAATQPEQVAAPDTPREALRRLVNLGNALVYGGEVAASGALGRLLVYAGEPADEREQRRRRQMLWTLIDLSTFRIYDAPRRVIGDLAEFSIGPAAADFDFVLEFQRIDGAWYVVVPSESDLRASLDRMISARGHSTRTALDAARSNSPRYAMREFLVGARQWHQGGDEIALARLDLSFVPERLYTFEAPLLAEYLKQVIDRAGFVTWQEIPDDPERSTPYVFYRHPAGSVVIDLVAGSDGKADTWGFTAETLRTAPNLFAAMQDLPISEAVPSAEPITHFFKLRESIRAVAPNLLHRVGPLDVWQWILLPTTFFLAILLGWLGGTTTAFLSSRVLRGAERGVRVAAARRVGPPMGLCIGSAVALTALLWAGLAQTILGPMAVLIAVLATVALGWLGYVLVEVVGRYFHRRAERTSGFVDEIATSLIFAVLKIGVIAAATVAVADISGLPYEGVIAGLGVGGVALAFAARDTVSNLISGAILLSDRPFRRGDLVEAEGQLATVERVGLRSTRLRTLGDEGLIIPNSQLTDKAIVNWGQRRKRRIKLEISLTYDTPRDKLDVFVAKLRSLYFEQPNSDRTAGHVGLKSFGASSLNIEIIGYFFVADYEAQVQAQHHLIADIVDMARDLEITFAFPTRTIAFAPNPTEAISHDANLRDE